MLADILHKVAAMENKEKEPSKYYPRPSQSGPDKCIRQMVYWATDTPKDKDLPGRTLHVFDDGALARRTHGQLDRQDRLSPPLPTNARDL